jgi:hypothetical protein
MSRLPNVRRSIAYSIAAATIAGPVLAVTNTAVVDQWWKASLTWRDALETLVGLPVIMAWMAVVSLPITVVVGVMSGILLAWRATNHRSLPSLSRDAAFGGAAISLLALFTLAVSSGVMPPTPSLVVFASVGALGGWLVKRRVFP